MDKIQLSSFASELEKKAFVGRVLKRMLLSKTRKPIKERVGTVGKSLLGAGVISTGIAGGGLAYGAVTQPRSIRKTHPGRFRY